MADDTPVQRYLQRYSALEQERNTWIPHWKELSENFIPRRGRALFGVKEANKGEKRNAKLVDSTPAFSVRTLASGMMAGLTNPSLPWMQLRTPDTELMEYEPVRSWLYFVQTAMMNVFAKSNFYNGLFVAYSDLAVIGTFAATMLEDKETIRIYNYAPGRYCLAQSARSEVDTIYRDVPMTVRAVVDTFGLKRCSTHVQNLYEKAQYDHYIDVVHIIQPNETRDPRKYDNQNMLFKSCYFEKHNNEGKTLREGGFEEWPGLTPRWDLADEDVYGSSPAMLALGDAKSLQLQQKRKAQAIDKHVDPPMVATPELKNQRASLLPGDVTYVGFSNTGGAPGFQPAYSIKPDVKALIEDINESQDRIRRALYEDLFLMFTLSDRREITAREVEEKHSEKLLMLGPVLQRLEKELLDPAIDRTFAIMMRRGLLPPPPPELEGVDLRVEYISVLAQAQRSVASRSVEQLSAYVVTLAPVKPEVMDKIDFDEAIEEYGHALGVPPGLIRTDDQVAQIRQQRAEQEQAMQAAAAAQPMKDASTAVKNLAETPVARGSALERLTG